MELTFAQQSTAFLCSLVFGAAAGLLYDIFKIIRMTLCKGKASVFVTDFLYVFIVSLNLFIFSVAYMLGFFRFFLIFCEIFTQTLSVKRIIGQYTSDKSLPRVNRQITKPRNEPTVTNTLKNPSIYATEKMNRLSDTIKT